jgi:hypothetical protein
MVNFAIKRNTIVNPINEFIPTSKGYISTSLLSFFTKNIFTMTKINLNNKWSFESEAGLNLNFDSTKVDMFDTKPSPLFSSYSNIPNIHSNSLSDWNSGSNSIANMEMTSLTFDKNLYSGYPSVPNPASLGNYILFN